jgi:hypothetical protein
MAGQMKAALGAIGVGLSVAASSHSRSSTVDAIAKMQDLAEEAGTTAEAISKFSTPQARWHLR